MQRPNFAEREYEQMAGKKGRFWNRRRKLMRREERGISEKEGKRLKRGEVLHEMRDRRVYFEEFGGDFWSWEGWW